MVDVQKLVNLMIEKGLAKSSELIGVSSQEMQSLEHFFSLEFPFAYRLFLSHFGRSAGFLSPWMAIYYDDLKEIRENFDNLNRNRLIKFSLPKAALLIANCESTFDFLLCDEGEDPSVYRLELGGQGDIKAQLYAQCFSSYLENLILTSEHGEMPEELILDDGFIPLDDVIHY